jgi:hypothetical protein
LKRRAVLAFFQKLPVCLVGIEACASSHYWSRDCWPPISKMGGRASPSAGKWPELCYIDVARLLEDAREICWTKNRRSPFVSWTRPRTRRFSIIS